VAYATEEILRVLTVGGVAALSLVTPIGAVIATMLAIVVFSYRQTIHAYPSGGGAYIVAKENLGRLPSLSLFVDSFLECLRLLEQPREVHEQIVAPTS
jgi:amino acid transporter